MTDDQKLASVARCVSCNGLGSRSSPGGGWRVCSVCSGSGLTVVQPAPDPLPVSAVSVVGYVPQDEHDRLLRALRDEKLALVAANRQLEAERRELAASAEQIERLRGAVAEAHGRARAAVDENLTAKQLIRAVLWRLDMLGDTEPSSLRFGCEALLMGKEKGARKNLDHALPAPPDALERLTPEHELAIRMRWANAPEMFQADADAMLREMATLRVEHRLGAAHLAALNGGPPAILPQLVEAERKGADAAARAVALALVEGVRGMLDDTDGPEDLPTLDALNGLAPALREAVLGAVRKIEERTARQLLERIRGLLS